MHILLFLCLPFYQCGVENPPTENRIAGGYDRIIEGSDMIIEGSDSISESSNRIVGGQIVGQNQFPWLVSYFFLNIFWVYSTKTLQI